MKEGINLSIEKSETIRRIAREHYKNNLYVYITHRINSYSIDPMVYTNEETLAKNLIGFAVVSDAPFQKNLVKYEEHFFSKKLKHFKTTEEALKWKDEIIRKNYKQA